MAKSHSASLGVPAPNGSGTAGPTSTGPACISVSPTTERGATLLAKRLLIDQYAAGTGAGPP
jgi:hypothetical protein